MWLLLMADVDCSLQRQLVGKILERLQVKNIYADTPLCVDSLSNPLLFISAVNPGLAGAPAQGKEGDAHGAVGNQEHARKRGGVCMVADAPGG